MPLRPLCLFLLFGFAVFSGCTTTPTATYQVAPTVIPQTTQEMKTPGFWIGRHPFPDKVIFSAEDIQTFNQRIREELKLTKDITRIPAIVPGAELRSELEKIVSDIQPKGYYTTDGVVAPEGLFASMKEQMDLAAIPADVSVQYGLTVRFSDQRFLPMKKGLYAKKGDIDFDELQNSDLDMGTPVAVLHKSRDGQWYYVKTDISDGWVEAKNVALCPLGELQTFRSAPSWAVVVKAKADIYLDEQMMRFCGFVRMGTVLPIVPIHKIDNNGLVEVSLPLRQDDGHVVFRTGYISGENIHRGFLTYTPRQAIKQAFELLNAPYGWGGMNGEQDCSRFLHEVFSTFGINLPRNSKEQAQAGKALVQFEENLSGEEKQKAIQEQAVGGLTLLGMKGHIMLYLGSVDGRPYAIHATWGYRVPTEKGEDAVCVVNRVIVSDLSLGEGSKKGSLLHRIHSAVLIGP